MPLVTTRELVDDAMTSRRGVPAFNVITLEHAEAVILGAERSGIGVIAQISQNAVRFHGGLLRPLARAVAAIACEAVAPISLHLDHIDDVTLLEQAVTAGFSSVMYDVSRRSYDENVAETRRAAKWAHDNGLWIEAELGEVGGKLGAHDFGARTDPAEAAAYVSATGVDALAVAVGSSHAMLERTAVLDSELISRLRASVPVPLVLHGSSGVPDHQLRTSVEHGMVKINIGTALNIAFTSAVRRRLSDDGRLVDPRTYLTPAREAMAEAVAALARTVSGFSGDELSRSRGI